MRLGSNGRKVAALAGGAFFSTIGLAGYADTDANTIFVADQLDSPSSPNPGVIQAGWTKFVGFENTAAWMGNPDWGLGLPLPNLMAALATGAELLGGLALLRRRKRKACK